MDPEITPVEAFIVMPEGRPVADQAYGVTPPAAVMVAEYATPATPAVRDVVVTDRPALIDKVKSLPTESATGLVESVTVTCTGKDPAAAGVPEITPLVALMVSGDGSPVADHE